MTRSGTAYLLPPLVRLTDAIDSGSWPTPIVPNGGRSVAHVSEWRGRSAYHNGKKVQVDLNQTVKMLLPTPTANRYGSTNNGCPGDGRTEYRTKGTPSLETMAKHNRWPEHFPTPDANNFRDGTKLRTPSPGRQPGTRHGMSLHHYAARFPTPTEGDSKASGSRNTPGSKAHSGTSLTDFVRQDGGTGRRMWRTPQSGDGENHHQDTDAIERRWRRGKQVNLSDQVRMWPTPSASLGEHAGLVTPAKAREGGTLVEAVSNRQMWPTPKGSAAGPDFAKTDRSSTGISLQTAVAMYPTPTVQDANNNGGPSQSERHSKSLNAVAGGALNPEWVCWLMGFPPSWLEVD